MSTKNTIWFGTDEKGRDCHLYWELAERTHEAAPIYLRLEGDGREAAIRLPTEIAQQIRDVLVPNAPWRVT